MTDLISDSTPQVKANTSQVISKSVSDIFKDIDKNVLIGAGVGILVVILIIVTVVVVYGIKHGQDDAAAGFVKGCTNLGTEIIRCLGNLMANA
ncbi:uncharacterized [Lates japonicus]